jgi:acetaldehyde dehydrogenase
MSERARAVILGSGNIGTDLMYKLLRSTSVEPVALVGIDPESEGLSRACTLGVEATAEGVEWIVRNAERFELVFDATSAGAHRAHAPALIEAGLQVIDLTPAKLGPGVVPTVNIDSHWQAPDVNLVTCGGQATIPIVAAVSRVCPVPYAEIVATIASRSAGPGTRQSIDAFTRTTSRGIEEIGGAERGKAIIILNPAEPAINMRDTVFCTIPQDADRAAIVESVTDMVAAVATYVPGYRLRVEPIFDEERVAIFIDVEGAGDFLPAFAGNLDIMTSAAVAVAERLVAHRAHARVAS